MRSLIQLLVLIAIVFALALLVVLWATEAAGPGEEPAATETRDAADSTGSVVPAAESVPVAASAADDDELRATTPRHAALRMPVPPLDALLEVFVHDLAGRPVKNAVLVPFPPFGRTGFTDETGIATFASLVEQVQALQVSAPDFEDDVLHLDRHAGRLAIALAPAARLDVLLEVPPGSSPDGLELVLVYREEHAPELVPPIPTPYDWDARIDLDATRPDGAGRAVFRDVESDLALELHVRDAVGLVGHVHPVDPLGVGEQRTEVVEAGLAARFLIATVVDPAGRAVDEAAVTLGVLHEGDGPGPAGSRTAEAVTDENGEVVLGPFYLQTVALRAAKRGFAPLIHPDFALPAPDAPPLVLQLERGEDFVLDVRLANGESMPLFPEEVDVRLEQLALHLDAEPAGEHSEDLRVRVLDAPARTVTVLVDWAGRVFRIVRLPGESPVRLDLPLPGRCEAARARWRGYTATLCRLADPSTLSRGTQDSGRATFDEVAPGTYDLRIEPIEQYLPGRDLPEPPADRTRTVRIEIRSGETTEVALP